MKITVAVVTHNGEKVIEECLTAIRALRNVEFELLVIDNASTDGTRDLVRTRFSEARLIDLPANRGPNPARNAGLRNGGSRYVLLVDDDVVLEPDSVRPLIDVMLTDPNVAVTTGRTVYYDRPDTVQYSWMHPHFMGEAVFLNGERKLAECPPELRAVPICAGTFMLIDRDKAAHIGDFDEHYFFGKTDADFTLRVTLAGYDVVEVPNSVARHKVKLRGLSHVDMKVRYRWYFMLKLWSLRTLLLISPVLLLEEVVRIGFLTSQGAFGGWLRGTAAALGDVPQVVRARRRVQRLRKRRDSDAMIGGETVLRADIVSNPAALRLKRAYDAVTTGYWKAIRPFV
jgi:GT2 family glycosyltransferase